MRFLFLIIGTAAAVFLLIAAKKGEKYAEYTESLDSAEYPVKSLYVIGYAMNENPRLTLKGKLREKLIGEAKMLYDPKYADFYAEIAWVQALSFVAVVSTVGFVLAGLTGSAFMAVIGLAAAGVFGGYFITRMKEMLKTRENECTAELPEIVSAMALLINAGMLMRDAWKIIAQSKEGKIYDLMLVACEDMKNGMSDADAIAKFGRLSNSPEIRKFSGALVQSIEHGGADIPDFLCRQSTEMWHLKKQLMLQKGESAATKLLLPTVMLFIAIIAVVFSGAVGMLV